MIRVNLIVEGQTEETFVNEILAEILGSANIGLVARAVMTSRDRRTNKTFRGGLIDYIRAKRDIEQWLKQDKEAYVSTMFDLFRLPNDFPGYAKAMQESDCYKKAQIIESDFAADVADHRFIPYIQVHEFEALLYSAPQAIAAVLKLNAQESQQIVNICQQFKTPEHINGGQNTAPSKRLLSICPSYQKPLDGVRIAKEAGLETIRQKCLRFHQWLERIESLAR